MEVKSMSIDDIEPYENNPRDNDDAVDAVANSIKEFGLVSCRTENQILAELDRDLSKEKKKKHGSTGHNQGKKSDSR